MNAEVYSVVSVVRIFLQNNDNHCIFVKFLSPNFMNFRIRNFNSDNRHSVNNIKFTFWITRLNLRLHWDHGVLKIYGHVAKCDEFFSLPAFDCKVRSKPS